MEENEGEDGQSVYFLSCVNVAIKLCATFNRVPSSISRPTSCIPKGSNGCPSLLENPVGTEIAGSPEKRMTSGESIGGREGESVVVVAYQP